MNVMKFLILCQLDMEQRDEAVRTLDRMLERFPGYGWAEAARARIQTRRGRNGD
jgi:TolA-binding protein